MSGLFDPLDDTMTIRELSRKCDPATSKLAGSQLVTSGECSRLEAAALELVKQHPGSTAGELNVFAGWQVHKRLVALERAGKIRRGPARESHVSKRLNDTWVPVEGET